MPYIDTVILKQYIGTALTGDDELLANCILRAQQQIDTYCKTTFESSSGVMYYKADALMTLPQGSQWRPAGSGHYNAGSYSWDVTNTYSADQYGKTVLWLGRDLTSVTTLTNGDETVITSTGYWLEPRNDKPYQCIRLRTGQSWIFDTDGEISVDGFWGASTAADANIVQACIRMATYLYRQKDTGVFNVTATPELGTVQVAQGMPDDVREILDNGYVRKTRAY